MDTNTDHVTTARACACGVKSMQAFFVVLPGLISAILSSCILLVPGPVSSIMVVDLNSTAVQVSWSPPAITNGIIVRYNVTILDTDIPPEIISNTNLDNYIMIISRVTVFTEYTVSVTTATRIGEVEAMLRMVMTDPFAASLPDIALTEVNLKSVRVEWSYPAFPRGFIVGYLIEVTSETMTVVDTRNVTLPTLNDNSNQTALVTGLSPFTLYIFRVRGYSYKIEPFFIHLGGMAEDRQTT